MCCLHGLIHATKIVNTEILLTENFKDKGLPDIGLDMPLSEGDALNLPVYHSEVTVIHVVSFVPSNEIQHGPLAVENKLLPL